MDLIKKFFSGYGSSLELYPNCGYIQQDWQFTGKYLEIAITDFSEIEYAKKTSKRKNK